jgi:vacuolar-type H+-ATPase subunit C/Vma6
MIDNVMLLLKGTLSGRSASELIEQCHPLGLFKVCALQITFTTFLVDWVTWYHSTRRKAYPMNRQPNGLSVSPWSPDTSMRGVE